MTINKKMLAVAVAASLFTTAANAAVTLSAAGTDSPVTVASELRGSQAITNSSNVLDIITPVSRAMSTGEVRYARVECTSNVKFQAGTTVIYSDTADPAPAVTGDATIGAVNGIGTSAISFSVTANNEGVGNESTDTFTVTGDRLVSPVGDASCTYSLYDQPSQAASGGDTGLIARTTGEYLTTESGYLFTADGRALVANVEAAPAYTQFTSGSSGVTLSTTTGKLADIVYKARDGVQLDYDGMDIALADMMAASTKLVITGDFSLAANADGTYTGAALDRVYLSTSLNCDTSGVGVAVTPATSVTANSATFTLGSTAFTGAVCYKPNGGDIEESTYTFTLDATSANTTKYSVLDTVFTDEASITRNGTELQAPFVQMPAGYFARVVLTNKGNAERPYTVRALKEDGSSFAVTSANGTVPANGMRVIDLNTIATAGTGTPRGALIFTINAPNSQIQGMYQIVEPSKGAIDNETMVRPGQ